MRGKKGREDGERKFACVSFCECVFVRESEEKRRKGGGGREIEEKSSGGKEGRRGGDREEERERLCVSVCAIREREDKREEETECQGEKGEEK